MITKRIYILLAICLILVFGLIIIKNQIHTQFTGEGRPRIDEVTAPEPTVLDKMEMYWDRVTDGMNNG